MNNPITDEQRSNLLCSALEGGSNYWCDTIDRHGVTVEQAKYRSDVPFVVGGWLEVVEQEPHDKARTNKSYRLDLGTIQHGLNIMAEKYPIHFNDVKNDTSDAITGDVFLQCCLFGSVIYG